MNQEDRVALDFGFAFVENEGLVSPRSPKARDRGTLRVMEGEEKFMIVGLTAPLVGATLFADTGFGDECHIG